MLNRTTLLRTPHVAVVDVVCDGTTAGTATEASDADLVVLPRRGVFTVLSHAGPTVADATHAWFLNAGHEYRVTHSNGTGDATTVIALAPELLDEIVRSVGLRGPAGRPAFPAGHAVLESRLDYRHRRFVSELCGDARCDPAGLEEDALDLVASTLAGARPLAMDRTVLPGHRAAVARAQELIHARLDEGITLGELARYAGLSPWHLSRTFNRLTGTSIRTYRTRLRLRAAIDRLLAGEASITRLAHDLGFADHSHLTNVARRELGMAPRELREAFVTRQARRDVPA